MGRRIAETERLIIRTHEASDVELLARPWCDPTATTCMGGPRDFDRVCQSIRDDVSLPEQPLVYLIVPRLWGRGYATEASQAIKIHALTRLSRERLVALIHPDDQASARVASARNAGEDCEASAADRQRSLTWAQHLKRVFAIDIGLSSRRIPGKRSDAVARVARRRNPSIDLIAPAAQSGPPRRDARVRTLTYV